MTARQLIDSIYQRPHRDSASEVRPLTREQFAYVRGLIERDAERHCARYGTGESLVWSPSGPEQFVLTAAPDGPPYRIARMRKAAPPERGLF